MNRILWILYYVIRYFVLFVISYFMITASNLNIFLQIIIGLGLVIYFAIRKYNLEFLLLIGDIEFKNKDSIYTSISIFIWIAINYMYIIMFQNEFYLLVILIFILNYLTKRIFDISFEEVITNTKIKLGEE